jgi:hypothetical protein
MTLFVRGGLEPLPVAIRANELRDLAKTARKLAYWLQAPGILIDTGVDVARWLADNEAEAGAIATLSQLLSSPVTQGCITLPPSLLVRGLPHRREEVAELLIDDRGEELPPLLGRDDPLPPDGGRLAQAPERVLLDEPLAVGPVEGPLDADDGVA